MAKKARENIIDDESVDFHEPTAADFVGKQCSYTDAIRWAFRKHRTAGVEPKDAPSEEAWAFFVTFRECMPAELLRFMDRLVPRQLPEEEKKDTLDDYDGGDLCNHYGELAKEGL